MLSSSKVVIRELHNVCKNHGLQGSQKRMEDSMMAKLVRFSKGRRNGRWGVDGIDILLSICNLPVKGARLGSTAMRYSGLQTAKSRQTETKPRVGKRE